MPPHTLGLSRVYLILVHTHDVVDPLDLVPEYYCLLHGSLARNALNVSPSDSAALSLLLLLCGMGPDCEGGKPASS
jgi:hypothetical protein